jgi:hypothetical protein
LRIPQSYPCIARWCRESFIISEPSVAPFFQLHLWVGVLTGLYIASCAPRARRWRLGDTIVASVTSLHVGNFAGNGVRMVWMLFGLALLFATGFTMWWTRVVRTRGRGSAHRGDLGFK